MGRAKEIVVKVIPPKVANEFVKKYHYSGKVVVNSSLHFGAFLDSKLHGVMSFGSPLDKSKVLPLVKPSLWNEMLELNRMAFDDYLPKNSESRCLAISIKLIKKNAPHIRWLLSFSDGTQSGDGTIYRASGFYLTNIKENSTLFEFPNGERIAGMTIEANWNLPQMQKICKDLGIEHRYRTRNDWKKLGAKALPGFQLRYIYLIDKTCKITVPTIPFSKIDEFGAGMYKGQKITLAERQQAIEAFMDDAHGYSSHEKAVGSDPTALNKTEIQQ
jgi:hypothetical protein